MHYFVWLFFFLMKGFTMDILFNCNEYSVANYLIETAKQADIDLSNIKLNNTMLLLEGWALTMHQKTLCNYTQYFKIGEYSAILPNIYGYFKTNVGPLKDKLIDASYDNGHLVVKHFPEIDRNNQAFKEFSEVTYKLLFVNSFNTIKIALDLLPKYTTFDKTNIAKLYNKCNQELLAQGNLKYQSYLKLKTAGFSPAFINDTGTKKLQNELKGITENLDSNLKHQIIKLVNDAYLTGRSIKTQEEDF